MNKTFAMIGITVLMVSDFACARPNASSCWYLGPDGFSEHAGCLMRHGKESLRVKSSHLRRLQFDGDFATVFDKQHGWMYVNRKGGVVVKGVMSMDNGPDDVRGGFVRYQRGGICGYASLHGSGTIAPQFDGCMPFEDGKARVCSGCRSLSVGEHHAYRGGESYCIDTKGKRAACAP